MLVVVALLASCGGPTVTVPREVPVPTPVPCLAEGDKPKRPTFRTDDELMKLDRYRRTHALWSERIQLEVYAGKLEAVVEGCSRIPQPQVSQGARP